MFLPRVSWSLLHGLINFSVFFFNHFHPLPVPRLGVTVSCLHPGNMVSSSLSRHWWLWRLLFAAVRPFTKSLVSCHGYRCWWSFCWVAMVIGVLGDVSRLIVICCWSLNFVFYFHIAVVNLETVWIQKLGEFWDFELLVDFYFTLNKWGLAIYTTATYFAHSHRHSTASVSSSFLVINVQETFSKID